MSDFSVNSRKIVEGAIRALGAAESGEAISADEMNDGYEVLNMVVKQLMGPPSYLMRGVKPWQRERSALVLQEKVKYVFKTGGTDLNITPPVELLSARYKDSDGNETPLKKLTYQQYDLLTNKSDTNTPQAYYYERRLDEGHFYLDCIPNDIVNFTIDITYLDQLAAFLTVSSVTDFPQEWLRVLKFSTAVDLGLEYGLDISGVKLLRDEAIAIANSFAQDEQFAFFQPGIDE